MIKKLRFSNKTVRALRKNNNVLQSDNERLHDLVELFRKQKRSVELSLYEFAKRHDEMHSERHQATHKMKEVVKLYKKKVKYLEKSKSEAQRTRVEEQLNQPSHLAAPQLTAQRAEILRK